MQKGTLIISSMIVFIGLNTLVQAADSKGTPTTEEATVAFSGYTTKYRSSRNGNLITLKFKPAGKLEFEMDAGGDMIYRTYKWWVKSDSSVCTETSVGETCNKTEKEGNMIYRLRNSNGERYGDTALIKK